MLIQYNQNSNSQTFCTQPGSDYIGGTQDGYRYELWNKNGQGTACMSLDSGALFSGEWSGIENYLARRGLSYNETQTHQEIGWFYSTYNCTYSPSGASGNSYLSIYGWTVDPLIEYYIVEDWRNWIPSMDPSSVFKDTIKVNGSIYDIYEHTQIDQPSIKGDTTFQQYFSIRRNKRDSGTINISDHFNKWESLGMDLGKLFEVSFVVEGYQNSGSFKFNALDVFVTDNPLVGTSNIELSELFKVFPNPSKQVINISHSIQNYNYLLSDTNGRIVKQDKVNSNTINISELNKGIYFLKLFNGDGVLYKKIIKE